MSFEFVVKAILAMAGTASIAAGIVLIVRGKSTAAKAWGAAVIAVGVVMWFVVLLTTVTAVTTG